MDCLASDGMTRKADSGQNFTAGLPTDKDRIARAIRNSAFNVMRRSESEKGYPRNSPTGFKFFRRGVCGDWKEHFGPEHKAVFKQQANPTLLKLGYIDGSDW